MDAQIDVMPLVESGIILAHRLKLPPPPAIEFYEKIEEVLFELNGYEAAQQGVISHRESARLLLQHFQRLVCESVSRDQPDIAFDRKDLIDMIQRALFGTAPRFINR